MANLSLPRIVAWLALAILAGTSLHGGAAAQAGTACSATQKCPKESPCCSSQGVCGSGALQCANNCDAMASFSPGSCQPNPICANKNITFAPTDYNNAKTFWPILLYDGDASKAPFTLDFGSLGKGPEGVLLELTAASQTRISTTDYMLYGSVEVSARHDARAGLVFAFITMSDSKDEIDWELTTANASNLETNYFAQGQTAKGTSATVKAPSANFTSSDWHTYALNWQPDGLQWLVDGAVVRNVSRNKAGDNYPRSPSRIQVSMWAGGNSTNPAGVIQWAGGAIDWSDAAYTSQGFYSAELRSFQQTCASPNVDPAIATVGKGKTPTSWVYTGNTSSSSNEPEFVLSTDPIKFLANAAADGTPNMPGYQTQTPFTKSNINAWDGSGDTSGLSSKEIGGAAKGSSAKKGGWLHDNYALSIAVPVLAGIGAVILLWIIGQWCCRRRRRRAANQQGPLAELGGASVLKNSFRKQDRYHALGGSDGVDGADDGSKDAPYGTQQIGRGYGPVSVAALSYKNAQSQAWEGQSPMRGAYSAVSHNDYGESRTAYNDARSSTYTDGRSAANTNRYSAATDVYAKATQQRLYGQSNLPAAPVAKTQSWQQPIQHTSYHAQPSLPGSYDVPPQRISRYTDPWYVQAHYTSPQQPSQYQQYRQQPMRGAYQTNWPQQH